MNLEELKQWTTDRLDYEDNEIGKEHSEYRGHYYAGVLALLAKLEAAQRLRDAVVGHFGTEGILKWPEIAGSVVAFNRADKEQQ